MPKSSSVVMLSINTKKYLYIYDFKLVFDNVLDKGAPLPPQTHTYRHRHRHRHRHWHRHRHTHTHTYIYILVLILQDRAEENSNFRVT